MSISTTIKAIQDIMRQDAGVDGDAQRISQLTWLLFLKIFDDRESEYELDSAYQSPIPEKLRWRSWARDEEGITGDELLQFVDGKLFPTLKDREKMLSNGNPRAQVVHDVFVDSYNYMKSGTLLRQVINRINQIDFTSSQDRHLFNDLYEKILRDLQSAGNAGEYYTPRAVTQFMVEMTSPQLGQTILDPACGTGGFLVNALEYVRKEYVKSDADRKVLQTSIRGIEKKPLPHLLATTNLILHDVEVPQIVHDNALTRRPYKDYDEADQVDVILTNPPFGGMEEPGVEQNFPQQFQTKETADLFLAMIVKLLKDKGGKGAIVLPDGSLFGEGIKTRLKEHLLATCNLHTIVRLPKGVFNPYTGINTNLLFFTKGEPTKEVWYFEHPTPADRKNYSKTRPIDIKEFDLEKAWWDERVENEYAWRVSIEEIKARNYNLDIKNPSTVDPAHGDPVLLLEKFQNHQVEIANLRANIKTELERALEGNERWAFIAEHFDLLFQAPELVAPLHQSILELAVRGKLTRREAGDGSARELLKRISEEKAQNKMKETIVPIKESDKSFELPDGWEWIRLVSIADIGTGSTPLRSNPDYFFNGSIPWATSSVTNNPFVSKTDELITEEAVRDTRLRLYPKHTLLVALYGQGKTRGQVSELLIDSTINQACAALMFNGQAENLRAYVKLFLLKNYREIRLLAEGGAQPNLNLDKIKQTVLPLPPLAEQERIVKRVEQLLSLCDALEGRLQSAKEERGRLVRAVMSTVGSEEESSVDSGKNQVRM